jgi:hypothetical protein
VSKDKMEERNDILNLLKLSAKPAVPENFFSTFEEKIVAEITTSPFTLTQLRKNHQPALPEGYFDSFEPEIENKNFEISDLQKSKTPDLPLSYFNSNEDQLINVTKIKKFRKITWWSLAGSAAAAIIIFFSVINDQTSSETATNNSISAAVSQENINETLLTLLDEEDLIEFIILNDVAIEDTSTIDENEFSDYSTEEIEEYYLELL